MKAIFFKKFFTSFSFSLVIFISIISGLYISFHMSFQKSLKNEALLKRDLLSLFFLTDLPREKLINGLNLKELSIFENVNLIYGYLRSHFFSGEKVIIDQRNKEVYLLNMVKKEKDYFIVAKYNFFTEKQLFYENFYYLLFISVVLLIIYNTSNYLIIFGIYRKLNQILESLSFSESYFLKNNEFYPFFAKFFDELSDLRKFINNLTIKYNIFESILKNIEDPIIVIDKNENIVFANEGFKRNFETNPLQKKFWGVLIEKPYLDFIENKHKIRENIKIKERFLNLSKIFFEDYIILIIKDISEIEKVEEKKREFVSYASHEIRTPMTVIKGYLETILQEKGLKKIKYYTEICLKNVDRVIILLTELLKLSKLEDPKIELSRTKFNIVDMVNEIINFYSSELKKNCIEVVTFLPERLEINADRVKFYQVFTNLMDNSIKFTKNGEIKIKIMEENGFVRIEFSDNGEGISKEDLPYIFDKFYVAKNKEKKGFGLGLAIVKRIILLHQGIIHVESTEKKGTKFTIKIPKE